MDKSSHILRQTVVTSLGISSDINGRLRVDNVVIHLADRKDPQVYPHVVHELIELGLMQHLLNRSTGTNVPDSFLVQYFAETKLSDILVWALQFQTLKDTLSRQEKIAILDRLFAVQVSSPKSIAAIERIVGPVHPISKELQLYQNIFGRLLADMHNPKVFAAAILEPNERKPDDQERYGRFLLKFYESYITEISKRKSSAIAKSAVLANPVLLLR